MNFQYIQFSNDYLVDCCKLINKFYNQRSLEEIISLFKWLFDANPNHTYFKNVPVFLCLNREKQVIGYRGFCAFKYAYNDHLFLNLHPSGSYVDPEYRRMGVFENINKYAFKQFQTLNKVKLFLNLSSGNIKSTKGALKLGWIPMATKSYLYKLKLFKNTWDKDWNYSSAYKGYDIIIERDRIADRMQYYNFKKTDKISILRDYNYYKWKSLIPFDNNIILIIMYINGNPLGYAILKRRENNLLLFEYDYHNIKHFDILLKFINKNFDYNIISAWYLSRDMQEIQTFFRNGYIHINKTMNKIIRKPKMPALIRPNVVEPTNEDWFLFGKDIRDISNWNLFYSDIDG